MIIQRIWLLANDHPEDLASCKWSYRGPSHLQMIIWRIWQLANDHMEDLASCKWSSVTPVTLVTCHPDSISRTFLEQFVLVLSFCVNPEFLEMSPRLAQFHFAPAELCNLDFWGNQLQMVAVSFYAVISMSKKRQHFEEICLSPFEVCPWHKTMWYCSR